jgi:outer membrane protein assembly factor BamB
MALQLRRRMGRACRNHSAGGYLKITRTLIAIATGMLVAWSFQGAHAAVEQLATYNGPGAIDGAVVGPGPASGSERLYLAYMYVNRTIDLISVDPASGKWRAFENPAKSEFGAIMALGPDGNIYLGTRPHAHIYQLNPRTNRYKDLGQPAPGEAYIYGLAVASDGKLYGCTYPSAKLIRYDPASGNFEDLGRMDPKEDYAKSIAASDDGFVYVVWGLAQDGLFRFDPRTRGLQLKMKTPLPVTAGFALLDGEIYYASGATIYRYKLPSSQN